MSARKVTWRLATHVVERERILRGWTRKQLAAAAGVDAKTVRDMLNERRRPTLGSVSEVARALERPLADLIDIAEAAPISKRTGHARTPPAAPGQESLPLFSSP